MYWAPNRGRRSVAFPLTFPPKQHGFREHSIAIFASTLIQQLPTSTFGCIMPPQTQATSAVRIVLFSGKSERKRDGVGRGTVLDLGPSNSKSRDSPPTRCSELPSLCINIVRSFVDYTAVTDVPNTLIPIPPRTGITSPKV